MYIIGINHKTAPISIREQFYLTDLEQDLFLSELKSDPCVLEAFLISTCNRTEIYIRFLGDEVKLSFLIDLVRKIKKLPLNISLKNHFYIYSKEEAINHFFRVACSLESLVLGEKQILGQVKKAVDRAREKGMLGKYFNVLTQVAIRAGKKVHAETDIAAGGSSVSWAAVSMAEQLLGSLEDRSMLIIGAGKMSELALTQITRKSPKKLYLLNRTESRAKELAQMYNGEAISFCDIKDTLIDVDFCICSSAAPHYIIEPITVNKVMKERMYRPIVFIDISMPRNVNPEVASIPGVAVFSIDDLDKVVNQNMQRREQSVKEVNLIVNQKIKELHYKLEKLDFSDHLLTV